MEAAPNAVTDIGARSVSLALQGKIKEARSSFSHKLEKWQRTADPFMLDSNWLNFALLLEKTGDFPGALSACDRALKLAREVGDGVIECRALYRRGVIQIRQGDLEEAQRTAEDLRLTIERYPVKKRIRYYDGLLALIALERKDTASAQDHLQKALLLTPVRDGYAGSLRLEFLDYLAKAYEQAGGWAEAQKAYEEILLLRFESLRVRDPGSVLGSAMTYYKLAKVLERQGDKVGAAARYRKFLDLWKNADPGLPEVEDAKKRLVRLESY
jgi:tetratricopeptide (TPR) repeat protein